MSAMLSEHLALLSTATDGIAKLRNLIMGLAISGKLVPQQEGEGHAISAFEKHRIPRKKPLEQLVKKFEIPASWLWCEVGDVCVLRTGATPSTLRAENYGGEIRWLVSGDIHKREIHDCEGRITEEGISSSNCKILPENSVLIALNGQGKTRATVAVLRVPAACNQSLVAMTPVSDEVLLPEFLYLNLRFRYYEIRDITGQKPRRGLNMGLVGDLSISLPPVTEQQRIVAKVDELMTLCDRLETEQADAETAQVKLVDTLLGTLTRSADADDLKTNWQRLAEHFDTLFNTESSLNALKQTILQLAVMGKLVPQDLNEEPASELLNRIAQEKDRLSTEEGLRTTAKTQIAPEEHYVDTPACWCWQRLGNLAKFIDYRGKTPDKIKAGVPLITAKNVRFGFISREPYEFISEREYAEWMTRGFPRVGDILFTTEAPLGNVAIVDIEEKFALAQRVICFQLHEPQTAAYLRLALMSEQVRQKIEAEATGMTATGIKASRLKEVPVPFPPLAEQQRIVAKVDELMALCDRLKADLVESRNRQVRLASTLIETALKAA